MSKILQSICWLLSNRNGMGCLFSVLDKCNKCKDCKHNEWGDINS